MFLTGRQDAVYQELGVTPSQTRVLPSVVVTLMGPCLYSGRGKSQEVGRTSAELQSYPPIAVRDPYKQENCLLWILPYYDECNGNLKNIENIHPKIEIAGIFIVLSSTNFKLNISFVKDFRYPNKGFDILTRSYLKFYSDNVTFRCHFFMNHLTMLTDTGLGVCLGFGAPPSSPQKLEGGVPRALKWGPKALNRAWRASQLSAGATRRGIYWPKLLVS